MTTEEIEIGKPIEIDGKRVAYWLNQMEPDPNYPGRFRVCLVVAGEPGYSKMGDESKGQAPWYWDDKTCAEQNRKLGNTLLETAKIIASSMFGHKGN